MTKKMRTIKAWADVGSHGGIFAFESGPLARDYPGLLHIFKDEAPGLVPVIIRQLDVVAKPQKKAEWCDANLIDRRTNQKKCSKCLRLWGSLTEGARQCRKVKKKKSVSMHRCQFCHISTPAKNWGEDDKCPRCNKKYDAALTQEGDDE